MNIESTLIALRSGMDTWNAYSKIREVVDSLARGELLRQMQELMPSLMTVAVSFETDYDKGNAYATYIDMWEFTFSDGKTVKLLETDVTDLLKFPTEELDDIAQAMGHDISEMDSVPVDVEKKLISLYERLIELARISGFDSGKKYFAINIPMEKLSVQALTAAFPNLAKRNSWVIYSSSEAKASGEDAGYWSHLHGWTTLDGATVYYGPERDVARLPIANEVEWRNVMELSMKPGAIEKWSLQDRMPGDVDQYIGVELQGVVISEGHCSMDDRDPQFFGLYVRRKNGQAQHVSDFWAYNDAIEGAHALARALRIQVIRDCGPRDKHFLMDLNQATATQ